MDDNIKLFHDVINGLQGVIDIVKDVETAQHLCSELTEMKNELESELVQYKNEQPQNT